MKVTLLQTLEDRYGKRVTIIAAQLPVGKWHEYINEPTFADVIRDRLTAYTHRVKLEGNFLRQKKSHNFTKLQYPKRSGSVCPEYLPMQKLWLLLLLYSMPSITKGQDKEVPNSKRNDTFSMAEIVILARTKLRISGDTITYTVDSFYNNPLGTTEDALKRIPGVEVSDDGKITIQGKDVSKIFINGKEYDAGDLRTITQNIPAAVLEKIQVADWRNEDMEFAGIKEPSDQMAINLEYKEEYKTALHGRSIAGYGSHKRYQGSLYGNYNSEKWRTTVIGNVNNTGNRVGTANSTQSQTTHSNTPPGINEIKNVNLNFLYDPDRKIKLSGSYELSENQTTLLQSALRTTYLPNDSLLHRNHSQNSEKQNLNHAVRLKSTYDVNERLKMISELRMRHQTSENTSAQFDSTYYDTQDFIAFRRQVSDQGNSTSPSGSISHTIQKRFKKEGRVLSFRLRADYRNEDNEDINRNVNEYFEPVPNVSHIVFNGNEGNKKFNSLLRIQFAEAITEKSKLSIIYTKTITSEKNTREVWKGDGYSWRFDSLQSQGYKTKNLENTFGFIYQYAVGDFSVHAGLDVQHYNRQNNSLNEGGTDINQSNTNYFPKTSIQYSLSKQSRINLGYNGSVIAPDLRLLQPIIDYTDSLNIYIGNPHLKPVRNNNISLAYRFMRREHQLLWIRIRSDWQHQQIINQTEQSATHITTTPVIANGAFAYHLNFHYSQFVVPGKIKSSLGFLASYSKKISITNGVFQPILYFMYQPEIKVFSMSQQSFDGDVAYRFTYNNITTSSIQTNRSTYTHTISTKGTLSLPLNFNVGYLLNFTMTEGLASKFDNRFLLANVTLDKSFSKPKGLSVRLQAFDIFNGYPTVLRTFSENYYEDKSVNRIGNYYLFSLIYQFIKPLTGGD